MLLDTRSLIVATVLANVTLVTLFLLLRESICRQGPRHWAIGMALAAVGQMLVLLRSQIPDMVSILLFGCGAVMALRVGADVPWPASAPADFLSSRRTALVYVWSVVLSVGGPTSLLLMICERLHHQFGLVVDAVPICSNCKKMRDDAGSWEQLERVLLDRHGLTLSHGLCPDCVDELYGDTQGRSRGRFSGGESGRRSGRERA